MPGSIAHIISLLCYRRCFAAVRPLGIWWLLTVGVLTPVFAGPEEPVYFETSVFLVVQGIGGTEMSAFVSDNEVYLPVDEVFDYLKIRNSLSSTSDTLSGFFITEQAVFLIDNIHNQIRYQGKIIGLKKDDLMHTAAGLFMKSDVFGYVFGLECKFNFRGLSVNMTTRLELPAIREMRLDVMHRNISRLKGEQKADTTIGRTYALFQFGMADWSVITTQRIQQVNDARVNLSLGAILAGGEATVSLNYNNYASKQLPFTHDSTSTVNPFDIIRPFDERQQYYRWRFVNNDSRILRQVIAGKIFVPTTASVYAPVVGVQLTNTPSTYRRSFGSYTLSNFTEPGWAVELYVNNELVDYIKADASGFYTFQVPLVYGNSLVKLRFYGPWGEERSREENISVPFNFLPRREFEYTFSAGVVQDSTSSRLGRAAFNYGATRHITIGGGVEYLSAVVTGKGMPFINTSLRLAPNLLFSGDYTYGVRARGIVSYRLPSNLQIEVDYSRYKKGQKAINYNYLEERKIILSRPFAGHNFAMFTRLVLDQIILPDTKYTTAEWLMSGAVRGVGTNVTTYAIFAAQEAAYVYSNFSLSFRLPGRLVATPQVQYAYNQNKVISARCELGKYLFSHGYMNISYEQNFKSNYSNIGIGLRYDFPFSQVGASAWRSNDVTMLVESARGSLIYDRTSNNMDINNHVSVGTGGLLIVPFLDLNRNGRRDRDEPRVKGLEIAVNGGRTIRNKRDTTIRILELEPYSNYLIDMTRSSFENVAWRIKSPVVRVTIDPNRVKQVEVPVVVMGEVSGTVYLKEDDKQMGLGRIKICFYKADGSQVACILTESDGFFNYMGLAPGDYIARADAAQLNKLHMTSLPVSIPIHVSKNRDGDVIDGVEFLLQRLPGVVPPDIQ